MSAFAHTRLMILATSFAAVVGATMLAPGETAAGGGGCHGQPPTEAAGNAVTMTDSCFSPTVLHADAGSTVSFTNASAQPHSVTGASLEWGKFDQIAGGQAITATFDKPGTYTYYCAIHMGMIGAVVVGDGWRGAPGLAPVVKAASVSVAPQATAAPAALTPDPNLTAGDDSPQRDILFAGGLGVLVGAVAAAAGAAARSFKR